MEDLLASIRKAIHDDIGEVPQARHPAPFKGTMRELRVRPGDEPVTPAAEIEELRSKISRNRESEPGQRPLPPQPAPTPLPRISTGFAGILGGERDSGRRPVEPAPLRPSFADSEFRAIEHRPEPAQPAREADQGHGQPPMISAEAAAAASAAFNRLADSILARATGERSIEELTRELLRGMLKQWLDENLPALVERLVREEIERVARRGR